MTRDPAREPRGADWRLRRSVGETKREHATPSLGERSGTPVAPSDRALVEELRAGRPEAVDEFIVRFEELVWQNAVLLRVPPDERRHWVGELLYDIAKTLGRGRAEPPRQLNGYVIGACRRKARQQRAADAAYEANVRAMVDRVDASDEAAVTELCSESALRDANGHAWDHPVLSPVLERLVSAFDEGINDDERRLLQWLAHQVSYTTIAEWLGISRPAAVSRIQRLRARLIEAALRFGAGLDPADRAEFVRFLRRSGAIAEQRIIGIEAGEHPDQRAPGARGRAERRTDDE